MSGVSRADESTQTFLEIAFQSEFLPLRLNIGHITFFSTMKAVPGLVFALSLIVLVLSSIGLVHAGTTYLPAVSAGQSADYKPLYNTCTGDPTFCASVSSGDSFTSVDHGTLQVVSVSGTSVTLRLLTAYLNGTTKSMGVAVDVYWGTSNITALGGTPTDYFVLAGGLQAGDHVSYPSTSPTLNSTDSRMVLGASRMVNFLNYSSFIGYGGYGETTSTGFAFDKQTGVFIEAAFSISASSPPPYGSYSFSFALGMVDNNIWVSHGSPDFTIGVSPTSVNTDQGSTGTSTISITRIGGLTSTIQLTASPSSSGLTCSLSSTSLPVGGDSSTLSCSGSAGTYTVIVTGDGGSGTHTVSVTFYIASSATPEFTGGLVAPGPIWINDVGDRLTGSRSESVFSRTHYPFVGCHLSSVRYRCGCCGVGGVSASEKKF